MQHRGRHCENPSADSRWRQDSGQSNTMGWRTKYSKPTQNISDGIIEGALCSENVSRP
jgi:hypothetical protein